MSHRVVIGGTRNCGKSTLAASLYRQLQELGEDIGLYEIDTFSDTLPCILGQKPWKERKKRQAGNWADPLIYERIQEFARDEHRLVIGDLPGVIDGLLVKMVAPATAAIVVGKDAETLREWEEFFEGQGIPVIIRVISHLGDPPVMPESSTALFVANLCREVHMDGDTGLVTQELRTLCQALSTREVSYASS